MKVRQTRADDIEAVMSLIDAARAYFRDSGIPQWQGEYPSRALILEDIARGESYVCEHDGEIIAVCAIVFGEERDYINIYDGKWQNDREYISIHRIAVSNNAKGRGVAAAMVEKAVETALSHGVYDIRCDTHALNLSMRRMLQKNGFCYCGVIYLCDDGAQRVAYHRVLE